jgi:hypothetical protein
MGVIISWPHAPRPDPVTPELDEAARAVQVARLSIVLVDELDFALRKLVALRGPEHALFMLNALVAVQRLRPEEQPQPTTEAPCA